MDFQRRVSKSRDGRNHNSESGGPESAGGAHVSHAVSLLGVTEVATAQEHLLPRFEGWHPEVGAAGTAESITQVALLREETITQGRRVSSYPETWARRMGPFIS